MLAKRKGEEVEIPTEIEKKNEKLEIKKTKEE